MQPGASGRRRRNPEFERLFKWNDNHLIIASMSVRSRQSNEFFPGEIYGLSGQLVKLVHVARRSPNKRVADFGPLESMGRPLEGKSL